MPSELEELVEFLHHGNTQIRQAAAEHLVGYSKAQPSVFKTGQLTPVKDLKLLVRDYPPIAKNALTILINISEDKEVLENLARDDAFVETLLSRITNPAEPNANDAAMLLANLAKSDSIQRLLALDRGSAPPPSLSRSRNAMDQLLACFVRGADGRFNPAADYDYLAYLFADVAKFERGRAYLVTPRGAGEEEEAVMPVTKLMVFTEHGSAVRRRGVASAMKNVAFAVGAHGRLVAGEADGGANLLPYLLLPLMGGEDYTDDDVEGMLDEVQLLPPDKEREPDADIVKTHLETLLLLTTTREVREVLRRVRVYPIVRETHLRVEDEGVREGCDRIVQMIMRDEEGEGSEMPKEVEEGEDEDEQIIDVL
ncbi:DNA-binding protein-like protein HGH1 [Lineolata rhizophorae]|uniref:Protein HGH1 homolog n=1 Tax=Lineolata rhizophorae TaxID=578093 RepID=A0A6A6P263_9PEZI|nr:DNA-binding protein-like protein HGH1 [Lineolata rhizophorae]